MPDLDLYKSRRGWLLEHEPTAPRPMLASTDDVAVTMKDLTWVVSKYADFKREYLDRDDGRQVSYSSTRCLSRAAPPATGG